jgi:hypothetical protein
VRQVSGLAASWRRLSGCFGPEDRISYFHGSAISDSDGGEAWNGLDFNTQ